MGAVIDFEAGAVAQLRRRVAQAEENNQDLLAFARGHSCKVTAVHVAVLAAMDAQSLDHLAHVVTQEWPDMLGVDAVSFAIYAGTMGVSADTGCMQLVEPRLVDRVAGAIEGVVARSVERGHPIFGPALSLIRAEALVRIENDEPLPRGLLAIGQRGGGQFDMAHDFALLTFLGATLSRVITPWLRP